MFSIFIPLFLEALFGNWMSLKICSAHRLLELTVESRDTYLETGNAERLPAQLAWPWGPMKWNSARWGKKKFCTGPTISAKAGQKSFVQARGAQWTNQGRTPSYVLIESPFASVSTIYSQQPPPLPRSLWLSLCWIMLDYRWWLVSNAVRIIILWFLSPQALTMLAVLMPEYCEVCRKLL